MPNRPRTVLSAALNAWALEATVASRFLAALYRSIGDGAQASAALRAGEAASERVKRTNIQADLPPLLEAFKRKHPEECLAEEAAWRGLITSLSGIVVFLSMVEGGAGGAERGLGSMRKAFGRAMEAALGGYRAGFPDGMTDPGTVGALRDAARLCAQVFIGNQGDALVEECERTILEGLLTTFMTPP